MFCFIPTDELRRRRQPRTVYLTMISHGDKKEIRIEDAYDNEEVTDIKKLVIKAYQSSIEKYKEQYKLLLGKDPYHPLPILHPYHYETDDDICDAVSAKPTMHSKQLGKPEKP